MTIFSLLGEILIKDNGAKKTLEDINSAGEKASGGLTGAFGKIGSAALKVGAMVGIGFGFKEAISGAYKLAESASDLNEAQNVVEQTFGKTAKSIEQWTTTTEKSAGISQTASTQWAGFMGAMLKSSGVSQTASASMSKNLVQLTGDMSSFYNVSTSDMWEKIRSGISGETEPLKEIGINMSVANLQAYALAEGIKKPYAQMSQGEQTMLRYNYLMSVTKDAQGDFGRTLSASFANQMRVAQMNLADLGRSVGTMLLPAFMSAVSWFNGHMPEIKNAIANMISGAGSTMKTLAPIVKAGLGSFKEIMDWIVQHSELVKAAIVGIGTAFATLKTISTATKAIKDFRDGMNLVAGATGIVSRLGTAFMELRTAPTILTGIKGAFTAIFGVSPMILAIVAGIALLAAGAYLIVTHWAQVKTFFIGLWNSIKTTFNGIKTSIEGAWNSVKTTTSNVWSAIVSSVTGFINGIKNTITTIFTAIASFFTTVWNTISNVFSTVINAIVSTAQELWSTFSGSITTIFTGIQTFFTGIWEAIKTIFLGAVLIIIDLVTGNFTKLSQDAQLIWNDLKTAFSNIWNGIKEVFSGALDFIKTLCTTVWNAVKSTTESLWNGLKSFLNSLWDSIKSLASSAWNGLKEVVISIVTSVVDTAKSVWNGLLSWFGSLPSRLYSLGSSMFNSMKSGISSVLGTIGSVVKNGFNSAISFITSLPGKALQWGKDFINGLVNGIKGAIGAVGNAVEGVADKIRSVLHFSVPDEGPLTDYESWMPDFITGLAQGIDNNKFKVTDKIKELAGDMKVDTTATITANKKDTTQSSNANSSQTNTPKQPIILQLILQNGKVLAEYLIDDINELQGTMQLNNSRLNLGRR